MLTLAIFIAHVLCAQSRYRFEHFEGEPSLGSESAGSRVQDSLGFIWISYLDGLVRYDGYDFKFYRFDPSDSTSSPVSGGFGGLITNPQGDLWIDNLNSDGLLLKYDRIANSFASYAPALAQAEARRVTFDRADRVAWILTWGDRGLVRFNFETDVTDRFENAGLPEQTTMHDLVDCDSVLLICSDKGLWLFNKRTGKFFRPPCEKSQKQVIYESRFITFLSEGKTDEFWLNTGSSMVHMSSAFSDIENFSYPEGMLHNWQTRTISHDGVLWFGTHNAGLYRFDPHQRKFENIRHVDGDPFSLPNDAVVSVFADRDGNLWVGNEQKGTSILRGNATQIFNYAFKRTNKIATIELGGKDYVVMILGNTNSPPILSTQNEIHIAEIVKEDLGNLQFRKLKIEYPIGGAVNAITRGSENLWLGCATMRGPEVIGIPLKSLLFGTKPEKPVVYNHDPANEFTITRAHPLTILEDAVKNLWVGTNGDGLYKINTTLTYGKDGSVEKFQHSSQDLSSISGDIISNLVTVESKLWIVRPEGIDEVIPSIEPLRFKQIFSGKGISKYVFNNLKNEVYVGTTNGLYQTQFSEDIYEFNWDKVVGNHETFAITEDDMGRLWLSNLQGLLCYDMANGSYVQIDKLGGIDHTADYIAKTSSGIIITADLEGFSLVDPTTAQFQKTKVVPVLTELKVNNKPVGTGANLTDDFALPADIAVLNELVLDYLHNNFTLSFSAMDMSGPKKNRYRHRLDGFDSEWIETDYRERAATYTNLPAGDYTFRLLATDHHGLWAGTERSLVITILPPPWRTWWAYSGYTLIFVGLLWWGRSNIVQRERLKSKLELEHVELEKAKEVDKVKNAFFTNISHEFRTPLTLIKGPVQDLLDKYASDTKTREKLKLVQRNSNLLLKLINQLLDLAKLESGSLKLELSKDNPLKFIRSIASSFESLARNKGVSLIVNIPDAPLEALFDKDKFETIVINLVNNAVKFTSKGSVTVTASLVDHALKLSVKDTGIGIPADQQQKIFERFHQVSEAHKEVGTGIGLSLIQSLVMFLGGSIEVKSELGKGTEFTATLPIELVASNQVPVAAKLVDGVEMELDLPETDKRKLDTTDNPESTKPHVLVVEDNDDLRSFIIDSIGDEFAYLEAADGKQGLSMALENIPDLIISDVMMPEMDGITMVGEIRKNFNTSHIPLILLTAKSTEDSKLSGLERGANDYLTKPFNKHELLLKIRNSIALRTKLMERLKAGLLSAGPKVEVMSADEKFLTKVKEVIIEHLADEQLSVESLAEEIGMSRVQLYRKVSGLIGISVNELIRKLRLQKAAQLLQQNWGPVSQVAYEVGFSNLSYFSKVFKEEFGVLPSEYEG